MSKRIVCVLLALIMLVGLIPAGVITASAASNLMVSENAIKFIKSWETFKKEAYADGTYSDGTQRYSYGYGTAAPNKDATITETEADWALREELKEINVKVNNFAAAQGLNLSQSKHDALVSFSYNVGWGWMSQSNYRITKAVINGATGNDFLQAMTLWSNVDSIPVAGLVNRRMAEADMYLNGSYNQYARANYTYVKFDANGGVLGEDKVQAYDYNSPVTITAVPVKEGHTFLGWYESTGEDAVWVGVLNANSSKRTLYARWQSNDAAVEGGKVVGTPADYVISGLNFASDKVYSVPNSNNASVKTINQNEVFKVTAEYIDNNGAKWLKIESGWIKLGEIKVTTTTASGHHKVTVTADGLSIRKNPNAFQTEASLGSLNKGDQVVITETCEAHGLLWGKYEKGWIALMYTDWGQIISGVTNSNGMTSGTTAGSSVVIATGTVLVNNTNLNVRTGAGLTYGIVGTLGRNTKVDIYEITTVNGHGWGRISADGKWVCLDYVNYKKVDSVTTNTETTNGPATIAEPYKFKATVNVDGLNIYQDPTVNTSTTMAKPVASLQKNDNVSIFEIVAVGDKTFGKIISGNIVGWIQLESQYVSFTASGVVSIEGSSTINVHDSVYGATNGKTIKNGTAVTILQLGAYNDTVWGRVSEGWINLANVKLNTTKAPIITGSQMNSITTTTTTGKVIYTGIVSSGINLNVRLGAGVNYDVVHSLTNGTEVKVYDKQIVNGHYWGKMGENAWICLTYVTETTNNAGANGAVTDGNTNTSTSVSGGNSNAMSEMATVVNCTTGVNIRSTPSVSGALIGSAPLNSRVRVLETTVYNNTKWARTEDGWISMLYLKLDSDSSYSSNSSVSVNGLFQATVLVNQINVTDAIGGGTAVATMKKGESAYVSELQSANGTTLSGKVTVNGKTGWIDLGNTTYTARGQVNVASGSELIVRDAIEGAEKSRLANGTSVTIVEIRPKANGATTTLWGKISMTEWVDLQYVKLIATTASVPSNSTVAKTGLGKIAYADTVNVRKAAGTNNDIVTKLNKGTQVTLYEETVVDEAIWVRISTSSINGWVAKEYIEVIFAPTSTGSSNTTNNNNTTTPTTQNSNYATGMVNSNMPLKVRQQPDINAAIVTELPYGMTITIYEQRKGGSMDWGRIDNGWVSLSYVTMTSTGSTGAGDMGTIIKAATKVNVRAEATTESAKVGEIMVGSRVEVLDQKFVNGYTWYRLNNGWVHGDYIQLDAPFVGHKAPATNNQNNTPATGPQDEVGGMSTTAILKHRVNDVVEFFNETATGLEGNGTKLVNGETVVINGLKGFGTDVWANTKYGWFNLTDESINFVAVGKVNTRNDNYLMVRAEAGKTSTEAVDKIRDQASITLTGVAVANNTLWGKTAKGWVELDDVEMTCVKYGVAGGVVAEVTNYGDLQKPISDYLTIAKAKTQHISINVYNAVNGYSVGIFKNTADIRIKDIQANGTEIWGSVIAVVDGKDVTVWIKLSDVTYANIDTYITSNCFATASAGGTATIGTEFKATNAVSINNLTVVGGTIYGQVVSATNYSGWLPTTNLTRWSAIPAEETAANFAGYIFYGTPKQIINVYDNVDGTAVGTLRNTSTAVLIKEIKASGSEVWGKTATNKGNRWVKLSDLNYSVGLSYISVDCNAYTYAGGTIVAGTFAKDNGVQIGTLTIANGTLYGQVTSSTHNGAWVALSNLSQWYIAPAKVTTLATTGAYIFKSTLNADVALKDAAVGNNKGTAKAGETVRVKNMTVAGGEIWAEVHTSTLDEATNVTTATTSWVRLSNINAYTAKAQANYAFYTRVAMNETTDIVQMINDKAYLDVVAFEMDLGGNIWCKVAYKDTDNTVKHAYASTNHVALLTYNY